LRERGCPIIMVDDSYRDIATCRNSNPFDEEKN
jgi:hypothetical protein